MNRWEARRRNKAAVAAAARTVAMSQGTPTSTLYPPAPQSIGSPFPVHHPNTPAMEPTRTGPRFVWLSRVKHSVRYPSAHPKGWIVALNVITALGLMVLIGKGLPTLDHGWNMLWLAAGVLLAGGSQWGVNRLGQHARGLGRLRITAGAVVAAVVMLFGIGAANTIVVNGTPYAATSDVVAAAHLNTEVLDDLDVLAEADELLLLSPEEARIRIDEYDPMIETTLAMSSKYGTYPAGDIPSLTYASTVTYMATSAHWASQALDRRKFLIYQQDTQALSDVKSWRATMVDNALAAGRSLLQASTEMGIPLGPDESGA